MRTDSPFHPGELKVQRLANEASMAQFNGCIIRNSMTTSAMFFIARQNLIILSSLDNHGKVWVTLLMGNQGFIKAPDPQTLIINPKNAIVHEADPFWQNINSNPQVGILAIDLKTRRRLRVNGVISHLEETSLKVSVEQAFPNCPKYIKRRKLDIIQSNTKIEFPQPLTGTILSQDLIQQITIADSFFVGSASPKKDLVKQSTNQKADQILQHGCDVSHRGGAPGFVEVINGQRLRIPDYQGNSLFNTLGNIEVYPFAGIAFVDFENSTILQVSGSANILWDLDDPSNKSGDTQRFWELSIESWKQTRVPATVDWTLVGSHEI